MVTKNILEQYSDLRKEIRELKDSIERADLQLEKLQREGNVVDKVKGGEGGIQNFRIEGFPIGEYSKKSALLYARKLKLENREEKLDRMLVDVEDFVTNIDDSHVRRIVNYRIIDNLSWESVARKIGGGNTPDSVRKAYERYMARNLSTMS